MFIMRYLLNSYTSFIFVVALMILIWYTTIRNVRMALSYRLFIYFKTKRNKRIKTMEINTFINVLLFIITTFLSLYLLPPRKKGKIRKMNV